jgi:hypothetical protein
MMEGKGKLFTIECYMPSFEPQNLSVCKQHASMLKNDDFTFNPKKDLVLSMPYQFVANFPDLWSFIFLQKHSRALFDLHQTPN